VTATSGDTPGPPATPARPGPLDGVRVLDFTLVLAGPYCTMLLADLGAEVTKVEPLHGDITRHFGPYVLEDELRAYGGYFQSVNRGKRSLAVDLKRPEGRDLMLRLVPGADVVVENFRPGVMDRLGLAYETLRQHNPKLVYASVRGFGDPRTGVSPYADWPAFDITAQAMGGFMGITGPVEGEPQKSGPGVGDLFPATLAATGILAALHHAGRTGEGQYVDVAMYDSVLSLCERIVYQYSYAGHVPSRQGNTHPLLCPFDVFVASDGHVTIAAPTDNQWRRFCQIIGRPEVGTDERYATNSARVRHGEEVRRIVSDWTGARTRAEITAALGGEVPVAPVNGVGDIFADPHVKARDMLVEVDQPGSPRPVTIAGSAIKLTATPSGVRGRAPLLGEHTDDILAGLGLPAAEIARLRESDVLG
jgi:crotonobetainyl-CoA:carnitine CoA-transferase CaiB-like acyl-CoA transferase